MFVYKYVCMFTNGLIEPFVNILLKLLTNVFLELSYKYRSDNLIFFTALVRTTKTMITPPYSSKYFAWKML